MSTSLPPKKTFSNQDILPPFPVQPLRDTLKRYLHSLIPVVSQDEYQNTQKILEDFAKPGGEGERLHKKLEERSKDQWSKGNNWLEDWWYRYAYLAWPDPIPVSSNYYMVFNSNVIKAGVPQCLQAARITSSYLHTHEELKNESFPPEYMGKVPLCMNQYRAVFTTSRIPGEECDRLLQGEPSSTVVVISKKQFYSIETRDKNGKVLSVEDLETQFGRILYDSKSRKEPSNGMGILTGDSRPKWAKIRGSLEADSTNKRILNIIDKAELLVCLDEASPNDDEEIAKLAFVDNPNNRWYDKIIQIVVFSNGRAGLNGEHSPLDATASGTITDLAFKHYVTRFENNSSSSNFGGRNSQLRQTELVQPERLNWNINSSNQAALEEGFASAENTMKALSESVDLKRLVFNEFGSDWMKQVGMSPDSMIQMVLQLSYARIYGRGVPTYETGQIRQFKHGRTDNCRTFSETSDQMTKILLDLKSNVEEKKKAFLTALEAHKNYMKDLVSGKACDRYLLGYRILATEESKVNGKPLPAIFTDKSYALSSGSFKLSTSNMPTVYYTGGFGAATSDGYGICYQPWKNTINFSICSNTKCTTTSSDRMRNSIIQSMREVRALFEGNQKAKL